MKRRIYTSILFLLLVISIFQTPIIRSTNAATYTSNKISSGGSSYTLYLDLDTTSWTRENTYYLYVGLIVNSFGSGIYDFHEIVLWMKFDDGSGYTVVAESEWGMIDTEGDYYEKGWYFVPSEVTVDSFSIYIGSEFWEDVGWGDPYTYDGWTKMVDITVSNPAPPLITHPSDITYEEGDTGKEISWTATHNSPDDYYIYQDDVQVETGFWSSGVPITYDVSGLPIGDYKFEIDVWDDYIQWNTDTVYVHVRDLTAPIINSPVDITFEDTATGKFVEWIASDNYPDNYVLTRNTELVESGTWNVDTQLRFSLDNLEGGTYTYCLTIYDESGLYSTDCVEVTVIGTTKSGNNPILTTIISIVTLLSLASIFKRKPI